MKKRTEKETVEENKGRTEIDKNTKIQTDQQANRQQHILAETQNRQKYRNTEIERGSIFVCYITTGQGLFFRVEQ